MSVRKIDIVAKFTNLTECNQLNIIYSGVAMVQGTFLIIYNLPEKNTKI